MNLPTILNYKKHLIPYSVVEDLSKAVDELIAKLERVAEERDAYKEMVESMGQTNSALAKKLVAVGAERDAAVADLHHNDACTVCVGSSVQEVECDCECDGSKLDCRCRECRNESKWQWRGADKEGT